MIKQVLGADNKQSVWVLGAVLEFGCTVIIE